MRVWTTTFRVEPRSDDDPTPVFLRLARAIAADVRRGRLRPGDAVPGTRELARELGVHRNTVVAAYRELVAEGWLVTEAARGTFVSTELPERAPRRFSASEREVVPARCGFDVGPAPAAPEVVPRGALSLSGGIPDVRLAPTQALARAYRRALRRPALFGYGDPRGLPELREELARMLSGTRGLAATADTVVVTRGSQMAIDLVARSVLAPGDVVAVEGLGYRPAWDAFVAAGARIVAIPVDEGGLRVAELTALAARERVRAVYVTPHHQFPTTVTLAPGRRIELLALAARERIAVIEDDYDHEFHYEGRPILPLASADTAGVVVYVGTLSKVMAPVLRAGYLVAPEPLVARVADARRVADRQGDHVVEAALAELVSDGEIARHVRRAKRVYHARRDHAVEVLRRSVGGALSFDVPSGGTSIWARVAPDVSPERWAERAARGGVVVHTARRFAHDGRPRPFLRVGFAQLTEAEIARAVATLAEALPRTSQKSS